MNECESYLLAKQRRNELLEYLRSPAGEWMRCTLPEQWEGMQREVRRIEAELASPLRVVMRDA